MKSVSIIGVGRVGGALALALCEKGYRIENLISHNIENASKIAEQISSSPGIKTLQNFQITSEDIIFIAVQDSEIKNVVEKLTQNPPKNETFFFHTSGSLSSEVLSLLKNNKCKTGSIHPLVSISDSFIGVKRFKDSYFCVEGDSEAVKIAEKIVEDLGGKSFSIETKYKTLYHASAVTACGHFAALINTAAEMLETCGIKKSEAKKILMPLVKSTFENMEEQSFAEALTGTFARGDLETLEKHIETLKENATREQAAIYLLLGEQSLKLAGEQGINKNTLEKMTKKISLAKKNFRC
ncbi:MAG: DUF2520 domain-containing protein [Acidobacteriota bacterium]|nr:DUF2520 domain-containing protein [Acidobacteriota bacterium]